MATDSDEFDHAEQSFADVVNSFSLDAPRASKRRWWGRRRPETTGEPEPPAGSQQPAPPVAAPTSDVVSAAEPVDHSGAPVLPDLDPTPAYEGAAAVRPYAWTRGRTRSGFDLAIETLLTTSQRGHEQMATLPVEHRAVAQLCEQARSVAEVAALLPVPLGVARVLLGDMAGLGLVLVHQVAASGGDGPDLALMERVLSGLRRL